MSEITVSKDVQKVRQNGAEACRAWLVRLLGLACGCYGSRL
ncbi:hypothetical protein LMG28727_02793 [Paraburkholderia kirstenboschensis]|nr:hypothetical protein LMG28727_02793 [Paraburkholderia kirstenboschensis]